MLTTVGVASSISKELCCCRLLPLPVGQVGQVIQSQLQSVKKLQQDSKQPHNQSQRGTLFPFIQSRIQKMYKKNKANNIKKITKMMDDTTLVTTLLFPPLDSIKK